MSGVTAMGVLAGAAVAGTAMSVIQGQQQRKDARRAANEAQANANKQAKQAEQDMNRANQRQADIAGALGAAGAANNAGIGGTMLTGPQGVAQDALTLGKNTLLGG